MNSSAQPPRQGILLLLLLLAVVWFGTLDYRHLVRPDEGRYAEIAREMAASGDWVTPRLNGLKYFEKPALQYWATATAFAAFGENEWTARLWPALTGFLGILAMGFTAQRLFGGRAGLIAGAVLASSLLYGLMAHINTLDMAVSAFMGMGLCAFLLSRQFDSHDVRQRNWMLLCWAILGLAVLSKGLIGLALPFLVLLAYTLIERHWRLWGQLHLGKGLLVLLAVTAPWFVAVSLKNPEFFQFFFIHEHFERFLTKAHGRYAPWHEFFPILLMGILPWLVPMLDALRAAWKRQPEAVFQPRRFLLLWAVLIFAFFSASSSKLPSYILPIFPALALLIGWRLNQLGSRILFWQMLPIVILAALALWLSPRIAAVTDNDLAKPLYATYYLYAATGAVVWLFGSLAGLLFMLKTRKTAAILLFAGAALLAGQIVLAGHQSLSTTHSGHELADKLRPLVTTNTRLYSVGIYDQTLPFYLKRTLTLVDYVDEFALGQKQESHLYLSDLEAFAADWKKPGPALAVAHPEHAGRILSSELPARILLQDPQRVVLVKP
jgi:4-amino-4-deoxy-L-arabinose transferase-like glycosyltransferase